MWYNGYQFGGTTLYNPWSIIKCVKRQYLFEPYWINTSSNHLIRELISESKSSVKKAFALLLQGEVISTSLNEQIVFPELDTSEETLWGLLVSAGYLTIVQRPKEGSDICQLAIPNREVTLLYEKMLEQWFTQTLNKDSYDLFLKS